MNTTRAAEPGPGSRPPKLSLREPTDVLAAVPYLVGFHPTDSVVVLALRGTRLVFCARRDLPAAGAPVRETLDAVDQLVQVVQRQQADGAVVVGYGAAERVSPVVLSLRRTLDRRRVGVREALRAEDGRYWSYLCEVATCCPPEGSPYDGSVSPVAATATLAGMAVLPDRGAFEDQLKPVGGISRISMGQATDRAHERLLDLLSESVDEAAAETALAHAGRRAVGAALDRLRQGGCLDDDEAAWLSVLTSAVPVREVTWLRLFKARAELDLHRALWMDVFRRAEPDLIAAPGCLFAFAAWRAGNGALASLALERVLRQEPYHDLAREFADAIAQGVPPSVMDADPRSRVRRQPARRERRRSSSRRAGSQRR